VFACSAERQSSARGIPSETRSERTSPPSLRPRQRGGQPLVVDPFAGSGNTLHWIKRHLPGAHAVGFELDPAVFEVSKRNLERLALPIELVHTDHLSGLSSLVISADRLLVAFVARPGERL